MVGVEGVGGVTQFGGVPVWPTGQVGMGGKGLVGGVVQLGGVPVWPTGQVGEVGVTQFGGVPVWPTGQTAGGAMTTLLLAKMTTLVPLFAPLSVIDKLNLPFASTVASCSLVK